MEKFLANRFNNDLEVIEFHTNFLKNNRFKKPKIDYLKLYKFLINAVNFLKDIDPDFLETIGYKMYEDVTSLMFFKNKWHKKRVNYYKYFQEYLNTIPSWKEKSKKLEDIKKNMADLQKIIKTTEIYLKAHKDDKAAKKKNVDAIYEYSLLKDEFEKLKDELGDREKNLEKNFRKIFDYFSEDIIKNLNYILNIKLFYFSLLIFNHANNSYLINKFALKSGVELSMRSMIEYFIKNYEISENNLEWVNYLKDILKEIN